MPEQVEGVTVAPDAADRSGCRGIGIRWDDTRMGPSSPTLWVFDRSASRLLGTSSSSVLVDGRHEYHAVILRDETTR